jgi:hypothetical protein
MRQKRICIVCPLAAASDYSHDNLFGGRFAICGASGNEMWHDQSGASGDEKTSPGDGCSRFGSNHLEQMTRSNRQLFTKKLPDYSPGREKKAAISARVRILLFAHPKRQRTAALQNASRIRTTRRIARSVLECGWPRKLHASFWAFQSPDMPQGAQFPRK